MHSAILHRLLLLVWLAFPLGACGQAVQTDCFEALDLGPHRGGGVLAISDTVGVTAWRVGFSDRMVGVNTDLASLQTSFGAPDSVRFMSGGRVGVEGWETYRPRSWVYSFGSFSVFPDSTAVLDWFDVTTSGARVETAEGVLSADTRMGDIGRRYPRSWECRAVTSSYMHHAAEDPPRESLAVYDTTEVTDRRISIVGLRLVGRGGQLSLLEQDW